MCIVDNKGAGSGGPWLSYVVVGGGGGGGVGHHSRPVVQKKTFLYLYVFSAC